MTSLAEILAFGIIAIITLASAVLCVTTKRIMRAATFMLFTLFGVAGIYFLLGYTYLGAAQISIYAGGVTMIYVFAIQLVSKQTLQGITENITKKKIITGMLVAFLGLITVGFAIAKYKFTTTLCSGTCTEAELPASIIGQSLIGSDKYQWVLPFEFISVFLLACIIGGIVVAKKEKEE